MSMYALFSSDGELHAVYEGALPDVIQQLNEEMPKHTRVYFDGEIDEAFSEYYEDGAVQGIEESPMSRAGNPVERVGQRPMRMKTREWQGPDEDMPRAAQEACSLGKISHREVQSMSEEEAYERLRFFFVDKVPDEFKSKAEKGAYDTWASLTSELLTENYKTKKAAGATKEASPAMREAAARRSLASIAKRQEKLDEEYAQKMEVHRQESEERRSRGLKPFAPPKRQIATAQKKPAVKEAKIIDPETGDVRRAPYASSVGLAMLPHKRVMVHAKEWGPYRANGGRDKNGKYVLNMYGQQNQGECIGSTPQCRASCLVWTGQNEASIRNRFIKGVKMEALLREPVAFMKALHVAIEKSRASAAESGDQFFVRLNIYTDIPWELVYPELFREHSDVMFYDYTKVAGRDIRDLKNYDLTFSYGGTFTNWQRMWREYHKRDRKVAIVFNLKKKEAFQGMTIDGEKIWDGDLHDIRPWEPQRSVIGLRYKLPKRPRPKEELVQPTDTRAMRAMRAAAGRERKRLFEEKMGKDYFLVQVQRERDTKKLVMAVVPRIIGAEDFDPDPLSREYILAGRDDE